MISTILKLHFKPRLLIVMHGFERNQPRVIVIVFGSKLNLILHPEPAFSAEIAAKRKSPRSRNVQIIPAVPVQHPIHPRPAARAVLIRHHLAHIGQRVCAAARNPVETVGRRVIGRARIFIHVPHARVVAPHLVPVRCEAVRCVPIHGHASHAAVKRMPFLSSGSLTHTSDVPLVCHSSIS